MDTQVVISRCRSDGKWMPEPNNEQSVLSLKCMKRIIFYEHSYFKVCYHSKVDMSGHLTKMYMPLLYLNPRGLLTYSARTFPVYIVA